MRIPILYGYRALDPPPRRFLIYVAINVVSWQNIIGPAMVLFARKIDMPESLVGMLISFMPFSTLLLLVTMPLLLRFGPKRVMMTAWFLRNGLACTVFLMPAALATGEKRLAWGVLALTILSFCIMRALGAGGWLPWLHEIVPIRHRSVYFSTETSVTQLINVAVLFVQARLLAVPDPSVSRFLWIYGLGIFMGFLSLFWMSRIPGGDAPAHAESFGGLSAYLRAARDRKYLAFLLVSTFCMSGMAWFGAAFVLYLRDVMRAPDSVTMTLNALGSLAVLFTVGSWARFTERSGSGLTMAKTLFGHSLAAAMFLLPGVGPGASPYITLPMIALACVFGAAFHVAANRAMLNQVPDHDRVGYTALWTVCTALALGVTPLAAGILIERGGLWGFRACFAFSCAFGVVGALLCLLLIHDRRLPDRGWRYLLNPVLPLRTLGRIVWITAGLHESNRDPGA